MGSRGSAHRHDHIEIGQARDARVTRFQYRPGEPGIQAKYVPTGIPPAVGCPDSILPRRGSALPPRTMRASANRAHSSRMRRQQKLMPCPCGEHAEPASRGNLAPSGREAIRAERTARRHQRDWPQGCVRSQLPSPEEFPENRTVDQGKENERIGQDVIRTRSSAVALHTRERGSRAGCKGPISSCRARSPARYGRTKRQIVLRSTERIRDCLGFLGLGSVGSSYATTCLLTESADEPRQVTG